MAASAVRRHGLRALGGRSGLVMDPPEGNGSAYPKRQADWPRRHRQNADVQMNVPVLERLNRRHVD
jgi:hypothetical protein